MLVRFVDTVTEGLLELRCFICCLFSVCACFQGCRMCLNFIVCLFRFLNIWTGGSVGLGVLGFLDLLTVFACFYIFVVCCCS